MLPLKICIPFVLLLFYLSDAFATPTPIFTVSDWEQFPAISTSDFDKLRARDAEIVEGLTPKTLKYLPPEIGLQIFDKISDQGLRWGPMRLFADPVFQIPGKAIYIPKETFVAIDNNYDSHLLYVLQGETLRNVDFEGHRIPKHTHFQSDGAVVGNGGVVWMLYPHPIIYRSPEYKFGVGAFYLFAVNKMNIGYDEKGQFSYSYIVGRNSLSENFRPLPGPFNVTFEKFVLSPDEQKIGIYIPHVGRIVTVKHPVINRRLANQE